MSDIDGFLVPYLISQVASIIILVTAWKKTKWARVLFALLFFWAAATNLYLGITRPDTYQEYADLAIAPYRDFINGWFSHYNYLVIPLIAVGQFLIALGMMLKGWWVNAACIGAIIFLLSIAPLMVGAAFPFSLTVTIAAWLIFLNDNKNYIWEKQLDHLSAS